MTFYLKYLVLHCVNVFSRSLSCNIVLDRMFTCRMASLRFVQSSCHCYLRFVSYFWGIIVCPFHIGYVWYSSLSDLVRWDGKAILAQVKRNLMSWSYQLLGHRVPEKRGSQVVETVEMEIGSCSFRKIFVPLVFTVCWGSTFGKKSHLYVLRIGLLMAFCYPRKILLSNIFYAVERSKFFTIYNLVLIW